MFQIQRHLHKAAVQLVSPLSPVEIMIIHSLRQQTALKPTELARNLGLPASTVTNILNRLEKRGLIERIRDDNDRRVVHVRLMKYGQVGTDLLHGLQAYLEQRLPQFSPDWWDHLTGELAKLEKGLREEEKSDTN